MIFQSFRLPIGRRSLYLASKCYGRQPPQLKHHEIQTEQLNKRLLKVAIIGAPNAGKSTLLNRLVGQEISCVSSKVHTTRNNILGVLTHEETQIEFYDSPGLVTRQHANKFNLESSLVNDPQTATHRSDLIAVVIDASNIREQKMLNKGIIALLNEHSGKESILIMNKVDLIEEKRLLLDIGTRLTQGFIGGKPALSRTAIQRLSRQERAALNLTAHLFPNRIIRSKFDNRPRHQHVIDLNSQANGDESASIKDEAKTASEIADSIGFKNFSKVYSISALHDEAVDDIRNDLITKALPVAEWPHGPDYITNQKVKDLIHSVIRGKVLDQVEGAIPYLIEFRYLRCDYNDLGNLEVDLRIRCPENWQIKRVLGERGVNIFRIVEDSRSALEKNLGVDVKLNIVVDSKEKKPRRKLVESG